MLHSLLSESYKDNNTLKGRSYRINSILCTKNSRAVNDARYPETPLEKHALGYHNRNVPITWLLRYLFNLHPALNGLLHGKPRLLPRQSLSYPRPVPLSAVTSNCWRLEIQFSEDSKKSALDPNCKTWQERPSSTSNRRQVGPYLSILRQDSLCIM